MKRKIIKAVAVAISLTCGLSACGEKNNIDSGIAVDIDGSYDKTVDGSGKMFTSDFQIPDSQNYKFIISSISSSNATFKVNIASSGNSAVIEADDNVIGDFHLDVDEQAGTITFSADKKNMYNKINCTITINAAVNAVEAEGAAVIEYNAPENAENVEFKLSGVCSMTALGMADKAFYDLSDTSVLKADGLSANEVTVKASGVSNAEVHANSVLNAEASGTSIITYSGDPVTVNDNASGVSSIMKK